MIQDHPPLTVLLAAPRSFCAGVERAIRAVEDALERTGRPVYVRHEIVHNGRVVEDLRRKGAIFVEDIAEIPDGAVAIFSAHGVPRAVERAAAERDLSVLDATCPLVRRVHLEGQRHARAGREVIVIGQAVRDRIPRQIAAQVEPVARGRALVRQARLVVTGG